MKLGLLLHDPEEEHECFSDNTDRAYLNDVVGIRNVYLGSYARIDGSEVKGPSLSDLVAARDPALDTELRGLLDDSLSKLQAMSKRADTVEKFDQMIGEGNDEGNAVVQTAIDAPDCSDAGHRARRRDAQARQRHRRRQRQSRQPRCRFPVVVFSQGLRESVAHPFIPL